MYQNTTPQPVCQDAPRLPLDDGHISVRDPWPAYVQGHLLPGGLVVKQTGLGGPQVGGGDRGPVCGFSGSSRRRLTEKLMGIPWGDVAGSDPHAARVHAIFTTLTYPAEYPEDWAACKAHLHSIRLRLERLPWVPLEWALWKAEVQQRGAPHFHLVIAFEELVSIRQFEDWARQAWFEVVGSGDLEHLRHGVDVRALYESKASRGHLMAYLTKYVAKVWQTVEEGGDPVVTGRVWGTWGDVPRVVLFEVAFPERQGWVQFQRRVRRWARRSRYLAHLANAHGLRLFGGTELLQLLRGLDVIAVDVQETPGVVVSFAEELQPWQDVVNRAQRDYTDVR